MAQSKVAEWPFSEKKNPEGQLESQDPYGNPILQKVIFKLIDKDNLEWQAQWSWDKGKTWKEKTGFLTATKME